MHLMIIFVNIVLSRDHTMTLLTFFNLFCLTLLYCTLPFMDVARTFGGAFWGFRCFGGFGFG